MVFSECPPELQHSDLGTKQYWDDYYEEDLANLRDENNGTGDNDGLSSWFDDVNAPQKVLSFMKSKDFPLASCHYLSKHPEDCPSLLDLGTGNGQTLFQLRIDGGFRGRMVGVDYSELSVQLARELRKDRPDCHNIDFNVMDIIRDDPRKQPWWIEDCFDIVLDKGTFDAISLSEDVVQHVLPSSALPAPARVHTLYPTRVLSMVKPGGFLFVTSCNWTQEELIQWFTGVEVLPGYAISVWKSIEYPKFKFGGQVGQGVCTVCFKKAPAAAGIP